MEERNPIVEILSVLGAIMMAVIMVFLGMLSKQKD